MDKATLNKIKDIAERFINEEGMDKSEEDVQSSYTLQILRELGWESGNWKINKPQEIRTNKKPDIVLKGISRGAIFIIESKEPNKSLDDKYNDKTFVQQLCEYCNAEGVYWGVLTNFVEWRIYNSYRQELYFNEKYNLILGSDTNLRVNDTDDEKLFKLFRELEFKQLSAKKGRINNNPIYYKKAEEIRDEFFLQLKEWRRQLRSFIYAKNSSNNSVEQIDNQTQKILDRLIFIQVCFKETEGVRSTPFTNPTSRKI